MPGQLNNTIIQSAFLSIASQKKHHGKWIPIAYWNNQINREIGLEDVSCRKLLKALDGIKERPLDTTDSDKRMYEGIKYIYFNHSKIKRRRLSEAISTTKKHSFLCVETSKDQAFPLPINRDERTEFLQSQYYNYTRNVPSSINTNNNSQLDSTETTENESARVVTPTAEIERAAKSAAFILDLLGGIINEKYLSRPDLLVNSNAGDILKERVLTMGCDLHRQEIEKHYNNDFYKSTKPTSSTFQKRNIANLDPNEYPLLTKRFNIPLTLPAMNDVVKCITDLAREVPEVLELPKFGGYKGSGELLFPLVPSNTEKGLYASAKKWLPGVVNAAVDEESPLATYHVVTIFIKVLATIDPQAFKDLCETKYREEHQKIDPLLQKALVYDAKLAQNQLSLIKKYTIVALGYNMWQPLKKVQELDVEVFPVTPVPFIDNKRKRTAHYRSIDQLFKWKLDSVLQNTDAPLRFNANFDIKKLAKCHIIVGGDHGQGAFRMVVTLLLFSKGAAHKFNLDFEEDFLCGFIECKKDTYNTLEKTIVPPLDQSLQRIRDAKDLVFCSDGNGMLSVNWGAAAAAKDGATVVHSICVEIFQVGDLAYQLLVQGREGMSPHWCPRCMWEKKDWQACSLECENQATPTTGEPWTLEALDARLALVNQIEEGGRKATAQERKGVTKPPLFTAIPISNYISPLLHSVDLFLNSAKALLDAYIDYRLENRPIELLEARWEEADMKINERQCKEELDHAESLLEAAQELGDADLIEQAREACVLKRAAHKAANKEFGKVAAAARKLEKLKKHGAMSQALRQEVDQLLAEMFHILRSTYHGCDYEGNFCRKLMRLAIEAMDAIKALLRSVPRESRAAGCSDEEITKYCEGFKRLFQYFDLLSHYGYQPYGSITDGEMDSIRNKLVPYMDRLWRKLSRNVPPKVHVWQHLLEDLERFRGMKHHQESKIEVAHQVGKDTDQRFRSLAGSVGRKIKCAMKYQANLSDPKTKAKQAEVHAIRARKVGEKAKQAKQHKLDAIKRTKTLHIESILTLPEIEDDFPSLLELTVIDRDEALQVRHQT